MSLPEASHLYAECYGYLWLTSRIGALFDPFSHDLLNLDEIIHNGAASACWYRMIRLFEDVAHYRRGHASLLP